MGVEHGMGHSAGTTGIHLRSLVRSGAVLGSALLVLAACGGASERPAGGANGVLPKECPQPAGAYLVTYVKESGAFGDLPRKVYVMGTPDDPRCRILDSRAKALGDGGCKYEETQSCTMGDAVLVMSLALDIPRDPTQFGGTMLLEANRHVGSYRVTFAKNGSSR